MLSTGLINHVVILFSDRHWSRPITILTNNSEDAVNEAILRDNTDAEWTEAFVAVAGITRRYRLTPPTTAWTVETF